MSTFFVYLVTIFAAKKCRNLVTLYYVVSTAVLESQNSCMSAKTAEFVGHLSAAIGAAVDV